MVDDTEDYVPIGSVWLERESGRSIAVAAPGPNSPWWYYLDDPDRTLFYCCVEDFLIWKRFTRVR